MFMRGDLNKIIIEVNKVVEKLVKRIEALEALTLPLEDTEEVKKGRGRPPGSKNKTKLAA